ncbi:T9SS type A sorting domain-containing protein [Patiriisocius sp. Uisw_017]|jgi:plastocyanin|uniref:T9SS type A sorting domain-containing protein n=1 Tax=Patiriisocius sp. Uisw_017 TaxID=3230968 RepID=UPI0039EC7E49
MKKITLFIALFAVIATQAQQTFMVDWDQSTSVADASFTIETGDTVIWTWVNQSPHDVVASPDEMDAPGDFGSLIQTGVGQSYQYTFTEVAVIDYLCSVHATQMLGTLTIEQALSVQDKFEKNITFFPNPVADTMRIRSLFQFDTYSIYDIYGKQVGQGNGNGTYTDLNVSYLQTGVYFVKVVDGDLEATIRLIKK